MRRTWQSLMGYVACCCLAGLAMSVPAAFAEGSSALGGTGSSSLENPLVVPQAQSLLGSQGVSEAEEARRDSPEAAAAREASQTKYEGLSTEEAAKLAGEAFPAIVDRPAGGLPALPEGQHIANITGANSAQIDLGEGRRGVVQSMAPIATESAPGQWSPVDLSISEVGGAFRIANPVIGLDIPKQLQDGVGLSDSGVSLTPVANASGSVASASEGQVDGSVVFYGGVGVGSDVDELVKPETDGFSEDAILRSGASPEQLFYRVGLPEGGSLVQAKGDVEVVDEGSVIASVLAPQAQDAAGTPVGVSLSVVSGDVLELTVDRSAGEYLLPIAVDPTVVDKYLTEEGENDVFATNWRYVKSSEFSGFNATEESKKWQIESVHEGSEGATAWGELLYPTQGESRVYEFTSETSAADSGTHVQNRLAIVKASSKWEAEGEEPMPESYSTTAKTLCAVTCAESAGSRENAAVYRQEATAKGGRGENTITAASVYVAQNNGPSVGFNTTEPTIDGKRNVLYGSGSWLGGIGHQSAVEVQSTDPGVGVETIALSSPNNSKWGWSERQDYGCDGVMCNKELDTLITYGGQENPLPDGEDTIEAKASDAMGLYGTGSVKKNEKSTGPHRTTSPC